MLLFPTSSLSAGETMPDSFKYDSISSPSSSGCNKASVKVNKMEESEMSLAEDYDILFDCESGFIFEGLNYAWMLCLAVSGFLDMLACLLPGFVKSFKNNHGHTDDTFVRRSSGDLYFASIDDFPTVFLDLVHFLERRAIAASVLFSALWFIDAFVSANLKRQTALWQIEREEFLQKSEKKGMKFWETPNFVYYRRMMLQMALLPVEFYFLMFRTVENVSRWQSMEALNSVDEEFVVATRARDDEMLYKTFSARSKTSLFLAIVHPIVVQLSRTIQGLLKAEIIIFVRRNLPHIFWALIRNPILFRKKVIHILTAVRWIKYLTPLIGIANKLIGNVKDMRKKRKQRRIRKQQQRISQILWGKKAHDIQEEVAATRIQKFYSTYRHNQAVNALMALRGDQRFFATVKLQRAFKRVLVKARQKLKDKRKEFRRLNTLRKSHTAMLSDQERRRLYELQDEFSKEAKELLNRKLLLRPNTTFAFAWKIVFVACIVLEMTTTAVRPWLRKCGGSAMTVEECLAKILVPTRVSELPDCGAKVRVIDMNNLFHVFNFHQLGNSMEENRPWYCKKPFSTAQENFRDFTALLLIPFPISEWPECTERTQKRFGFKKTAVPKPWYCQEPYSSCHSIYRRLVRFVFKQFSAVLSFICFLDVFVTFFTGEFDTVTGELVPKPFFPRWILPGLVLQLMVNPAVEDVTASLSYVTQEILKIGSSRFFRWTVATIFPIVYYLVRKSLRHIWMPLVQYQNEFKTKFKNPTIEQDKKKQE